MNDTPTTKERLAEATVRALEAAKGIQGLSLRAIAKEAGCAHVSVYHHAPRGLQDLLWLAFTLGLDDFSVSCSERTSRPRQGENVGSAMARAFIDFADRREGMYRLLWFEALEGQAQGDAKAAIDRSKARFRAAAAARFDDLAEELDILFAYLQGEVALLLNGRSAADPAAARDAIADRAGRLWAVLAAGGMDAEPPA